MHHFLQSKDQNSLSEFKYQIILLEMDRFKWSQGQLNKPNEESVYEQNSVTVYNLDTRTTFTTGRLQLTSNRLIWHSPTDPSCKIELDLSSIVGVDLKQAHKTDHASRFDRTYFTRLVVSLDPAFNAFDHLSIIDKSKKNQFIYFLIFQKVATIILNHF
jgi:hypothetical protein